MLIQLRARYQEASKKGLISISKIVKNKPVEYAMCLYSEQNIIKLQKNIFPTLNLAISHATLYGFSTNIWKIEEKDI